MTYANGDSYQGNFIDGRKEGNGVYTWANGDIYEGTFIKNVKHGKGIFRPADSLNFLQCQWQNDRIVDEQTANITYTNSNRIFEGQIKSNGAIDGQGILNFDSNGIYKGSIKNNSFQGDCKIHYPNGDIYKGQMENNLFEGYGLYYYAYNKLTFAGQWQEGLQHGKGKLISDEGTTVFSEWQKGIINCEGQITYSSH